MSCYAYFIEQKELKKREIEPECTRSKEALSASVDKNAVYVLEKFEGALYQKLLGKTRYSVYSMDARILTQYMYCML